MATVRLAGWLSALRRRAHVSGWLRGTGSESELTPDLLQAVLDDASSRLGERLSVAARRWSRTGCEILWLEGDGRYIGKVSVRQAAAARLRANAEALLTLAPMTRSHRGLGGRVPELILSGLVLGHTYSIETRLPGDPATGRYRTPGGADEVEAGAADFLIALHEASGCNGVMDDARWTTCVQPGLDIVGRLAGAHGLRTQYMAMVQRLRSVLLGRPLQAVFGHGNFWPGNVLWDAAGGLRGVVDLDNASAAGLPGIDLIYFLVRGESVARRVSLGRTVTDWLGAGAQAACTSRALVRYIHARALPADLLEACLLLAWLQQVHMHARFGTRAIGTLDWVSANVLGVVEAAARSRRPVARPLK